MTASPQFLKAYKKATGQTAEKQSDASFDRCVLEVQGKGGVEDAYAVCTAAMKSESLKSMSHDDPRFSKEVEQFMRTLGISGAGPLPQSLMARQDLERGRTTKKTMEFAKKRVTKDGSSSLSVWYDAGDNSPKCEVHGNVVDAEAAVKRLKELGYQNIRIVSSQDDSMTKAGDKMFLIRTNGMEYARFDKKADAEECLAMLTAQGQFAVMIEETVVSSEKGRVETTGKQLDHAVKEAAEAEGTEEKSTLIDNIKNIQLRRQKATIAERSKSAAAPSAKAFKDVWGKITRPK